MRSTILLPALFAALLLAPVAFAQGAAVEGFFPGCGAPGDPVLIHGSGFQAEPAVTFAGVAADVVRSDSEHVLCRVPDGVAAGSATLAVDGILAAESFTIVAEGAPVVLRLSTRTVTAGLPLFVIGRRLQGGDAEFVDASGATQASARLRGGHRAGWLRVPETLAAGIYTLRITNRAGLDTGDCSPEIEVVLAGAPALDSIAPEAQLAGRPVVCKGSDLAPPGPCTVVWTDAAGKKLKTFGFSNGYDRVVSRVPVEADPGADYDVAIKLRGGATTADSGLFAYTVGTASAPEITKLVPDAGPAGSRFRIRGSNLLVFGSKPVVEMTLGGVARRAPVLFGFPGLHGGDDILLVKVPADLADGDYDVTVSVGSQTSNAVPFRVGALALAVTSMRPDHQPARGTFHPVAFEGTGFGSPGDGDLSVTWDNGVDAPRKGRLILRTERFLLVIPPGGRFDPLPVGDYDVKVTRGTDSVLAGPYSVK